MCVIRSFVRSLCVYSFIYLVCVSFRYLCMCCVLFLSLLLFRSLYSSVCMSLGLLFRSLVRSLFIYFLREVSLCSYVFLS